MPLLITDLDNTLYDWVTFFARSFSAMLKVLVEITGIEQEILLDEFKIVHQHYHNTEHPFAVLELPSLRTRYGNLSRRDLRDKLEPALLAFNRERNHTLRPYPSVTTTLSDLCQQGVKIVGHTEAIVPNAMYRLLKLDLLKYFSRLYALDGSNPQHPIPEHAALYEPPPGFVHRVPPEERKPNPRLLIDICTHEQVALAETWYVGDSLTRDISMAKAAGVKAIWAKYGLEYDKALWETLVRVTHWTEEDVCRESLLNEKYAQVQPDYEIESFAAIKAIMQRTQS